jgi:hypothetical protein
MKHAFHPEAFEEYAAAASAYEAGQPGLGARFIQSVESAIEGICQAPEHWTILELDVRQRLNPHRVIERNWKKPLEPSPVSRSTPVLCYHGQATVAAGWSTLSCSCTRSWRHLP